MGSIQTGREREPRVEHEIRIGSVVATVRAERAVGESTTHTVTLSCTSPSTSGSSAHSLAILGRDELLLAARALDQAHAFICRAEGRASSDP